MNESTSWHSYPSIYNLGHKALEELFDGEVVVEEKIDGSQFSFGRFDGNLKIRSKGQEMYAEQPEKMFAIAVEVVKNLDLHDGWTYRGEYLQKPKHNALAYDRIPTNHIIIFDINTGEEAYLPWAEKWGEAQRIGLEFVPILRSGKITLSMDLIHEMLQETSVLGGQKIEGIVIKNYGKFGPDKKVLMGKFVSEAFKEVHNGEWKKNNPTQSDFVMTLAEQYRTPARWNKAIQHLKEAGELEESPRDIGKLIKEVHIDITKECSEEIAAALFKHFWPQIARIALRGLPEWYKEQLAAKQFQEA